MLQKESFLLAVVVGMKGFSRKRWCVQSSSNAFLVTIGSVLCYYCHFQLSAYWGWFTNIVLWSPEFEITGISMVAGQREERIEKTLKIVHGLEEFQRACRFILLAFYSMSNLAYLCWLILEIDIYLSPIFPLKSPCCTSNPQKLLILLRRIY